MNFGDIGARGLVLLGCGKMGSALLKGWLEGGLDPKAVHVIEPRPSDWLKRTGVTIGGALPDAPAVLVVAVKPQMMAEALPEAKRFGGGGTLVLSIAAGWPVSAFEAAFGPGTPVVRSMPNTPAAVGRGYHQRSHANSAVREAGLKPTRRLSLAAVGEMSVRLEDEWRR